jgi:hypothetical protein
MSGPLHAAPWAARLTNLVEGRFTLYDTTRHDTTESWYVFVMYLGMYLSSVGGRLVWIRAYQIQATIFCRVVWCRVVP